MRRRRDKPPPRVNPLPSRERLNELLRYDEATGLLHWRDTRGRIKAGAVAGCPSTDGRRLVHIDGTLYKTARLVWKILTGRDPRGFIDHRNRDRSDERFYNLRDLTPRENSTNQNLRRNNTSGYRGVSFSVKDNRWRAQIMHRRKNIYLGSFDSPEKAACAYEAMALIYHRGEIL